MKLIIGLGNPGEQYDKTKHNIGFEIIDLMAKKLNIKLTEDKKNECFIYRNDDFILLKPLTYMNLSGNSVKKVIDYYKLNISDMFVICDDLDTPIGQAKIKKSTSSGGHNGIKSIISSINSSDFYRLKIGIGRPNKELGISISSYVLEPFDKEDRKIIDKVISKAIDATISVIYNSVSYVSNYFNKKD